MNSVRPGEILKSKGITSETGLLLLLLSAWLLFITFFQNVTPAQ